MVASTILGLAEINSLGYSCGYVDSENIVKSGDHEYRLFNLNYLTAHFKNITNTLIKTEKGLLPAEISDSASVYPRTDVWFLGHLLLKIFDSRSRSSVNLAKLRTDPIKELETFFGKNVQDGKFLTLVSLMLRQKHDTRCDYLVGF